MAVTTSGPGAARSRRMTREGKTPRLVRSAVHLLGARRAFAIGVGILAVFAVIAIFAPWIAPQDPAAASSFSAHILAAPSPQHWLGTDENGRDILSLLIYGARTSMIVGLTAGLVATVIGGAFGLCAGFFGGWVDRVLCALDDWFLVIPFVPLAIVLIALLQTQASSWPGGKISIVILVIGITGWAGTSRIIRSQVLSVKERVFVERSRALGASNIWILRKQLLPNVMPLIFANGITLVAYAILTESTLDFLGLGDPTFPSWGAMLDNANASGAIPDGAWWYFIPPGVCILLLVMGFTLTGYAIEENANPHLDG
jgi:peptide/nickel transport system permease protein